MSVGLGFALVFKFLFFLFIFFIVAKLIGLFFWRRRGGPGGPWGGHHGGGHGWGQGGPYGKYDPDADHDAGEVKV